MKGDPKKHDSYFTYNCTVTLEFLLTEPHLVCPSTYLLRNAWLVFLLTHAWLKLDVQSTGKLLHFHRVVYIVNITLQYFIIIFQMYICMRLLQVLFHAILILV